MHHLITLFFLVAAIACYIASLGPGWIGALFLLGMLCEALFWWRLVRRKRDPTQSTNR